jgi:hypothetical protein
VANVGKTARVVSTDSIGSVGVIVDSIGSFTRNLTGFVSLCALGSSKSIVCRVSLYSRFVWERKPRKDNFK